MSESKDIFEEMYKISPQEVLSVESLLSSFAAAAKKTTTTTHSKCRRTRDKCRWRISPRPRPPLFMTATFRFSPSLRADWWLRVDRMIGKGSIRYWAGHRFATDFREGFNQQAARCACLDKTHHKLIALVHFYPSVQRKVNPMSDWAEIVHGSLDNPAWHYLALSTHLRDRA